MAEQRYVDFIERIIQETKEGQLSWRYLDKDKSLYEEMGWTKTSSSSLYGIFSGSGGTIHPDFNTEDSFFTNIGDMYIVLYVYGSQPAKLYVIPNTYKKVVTLTPEEYGEHITRLLNLVQSYFPSAEAFIDKFLNEQS